MKINIIFGITPELAEALNGLSAAIASPSIAGILKTATERAAALRNTPPIPTYPEGGVPAGKGLKMAGEHGPETIVRPFFRDPAMLNPEDDAPDTFRIQLGPEDDGTGDPTPGFGEALEAYKREQEKLAEGLAPEEQEPEEAKAGEELAGQVEAAHNANLKADQKLTSQPAGADPVPLTEAELEEQRKETRRQKDRDRKAAKREAEAAKNQPKAGRIEPDEPLITDHAEPTAAKAAGNGQPVTGAAAIAAAAVDKDALIAATQNAIFKDPVNRDRIREYLDKAEVGKVTELAEAAWPAFITFAEAL